LFWLPTQLSGVNTAAASSAAVEDVASVGTCPAAVGSPGVPASPLPGSAAIDMLLAGNAASASTSHAGAASFVLAARAAVHGGAPITTTSAAPRATFTTAL
jgi:hypothetical protein